MPGLRRGTTANAPAGLCSRCLASRTGTGDTIATADADATVALADPGSGHSAHLTQADPNRQANWFEKLPDLPADRPPESGENADSISVANLCRPLMISA